MSKVEYWHGFENGANTMFLQVEDGGEVVNWIVVSPLHVSNSFLVLTLLLLSYLVATKILNDSIDGVGASKSL